MVEKDKPNFSDMFDTYCEYKRVYPDVDERSRMKRKYWEHLQGYEYRDVFRAFTRAEGELQFFPTIPEIKGFLGAVKTERGAYNPRRPGDFWESEDERLRAIEAAKRFCEQFPHFGAAIFHAQGLKECTRGKFLAMDGKVI